MRATPTFDPSSIEGLDAPAWSRWTAYRAEIKKPLRPASLDAAARQLAKFGDSATQAAVVEQSIANGWQGLFALKVNGNGHAAKPYIAPLSNEQLEEAEKLGLTSQQYRQEKGLAQFGSA